MLERLELLELRVRVREGVNASVVLGSSVFLLPIVVALSKVLELLLESRLALLLVSSVLVLASALVSVSVPAPAPVGLQMLSPAMVMVISGVLSVSLPSCIVEVMGLIGSLAASITGDPGTEEIGEPGKETQEPGMMITWRIRLG